MSENLAARISRSCACLQMDFLRGEKAARLASCLPGRFQSNFAGFGKKNWDVCV